MADTMLQPTYGAVHKYFHLLTNLNVSKDYKSRFYTRLCLFKSLTNESPGQNYCDSFYFIKTM